MAKRISETLKEDEAGLLFIREEHSVQFPGDVEVFSIFPPALDEIHRWYRDQAVLAQHRPVEASERKDREKGEDVKKKARRKAKREPKSS
jgi:hypothetical protein